MIKKSENAGIKYLNDINVFIERSNTMEGVYKNINDYSPSRKIKNLIVSGDMIEDIMTKQIKNLKP